MAISRIIASITQYISEAAMRIFGPNDDAYPNIGVQPFTGEPYKKGSAEIW
ncbi:MAG TPA: nicotinate phosphoribosyltransferase [Trichormus sp. M33_DOE_039]|nr:nicotinate phosphoribosyltransferase [Trichormus sp. M33_DOE_039]